MTGCTTRIWVSTPTTSPGSPRGDPSASLAPEAPSRAPGPTRHSPFSLKDLHSPSQAGRAMWAPRPASRGAAPAGIASRWRGLAASNVPNSAHLRKRRKRPVIEPGASLWPRAACSGGKPAPEDLAGDPQLGLPAKGQADVCSGVDCRESGHLLPAPKRRPALCGQKPCARTGLSQELEARSCPAVEGLPWPSA